MSCFSSERLLQKQTASNQMDELQTLICRRDLHSGASCLQTVQQSLGCGVKIHVHDDGSLVRADWDYLMEKLPNLVAHPRAVTDERVVERLSRYPACLRYRSSSAMGIKLFDLPLLCGTPSFSYIDSDVIFFKRVDRLFPENSDSLVYLRSDEEGYCAPLPELHWKWRIPLLLSLNAGLFQLPLFLYDLDRIEWFLRKVVEATPGWREGFLAEQTIWAMLGAQRPAYHFNRRQFHCSRFRQVKVHDDLVAVHLIYHLKPMGEKLAMIAMSRLLESEPLSLSYIRARRLNGIDIILRRLQRIYRKISCVPEK